MSSKIDRDLSDLRKVVASTLALLSTFQSTLTSTPQDVSQPLYIAKSPNPLRLVSDASSLLRAQTTKLSLLILNKPFTPSAITFILKNLSAECLPALMTALELCSTSRYTVFLRDHLRANVLRVMREMATLLGTIPLSDGQEPGIGKDAEGRDTLPSTGVIWEICDTLAAIAANGLIELAAKKADAYHALIKDAIAELEEWDPDDEVDDPFGSESSRESEINEKGTAGSSTNAALGKLTLTPPATPTVIRQIYEKALTTLRLVKLLYPALRKRRILGFPSITSSTESEQLPTPWQIQWFDGVMKHFRVFSEVADELAGALYSHDEEATGALGALGAYARECIEDVGRNWEGKEDEFTAWAGKWRGRLDESIML